MQDLINQIKEVRQQLSTGDLSVEETIIILSTIIDKFNARDEEGDSEKDYLKSLFTNKKVKEINAKNEAAKKRVKYLKILTLLHDLGLDQLTEKDITKVLAGI
ncbi:hypothetical protein [uncultured Maribacter sp.]|uniref:hypothetical protein n=1 Tax=uncultured Maribacter sp. TaxID=431308 RepID=UPI002620AA74|nr:hypothetical protein [uncultured Maribacter sp.]